MNKLYLIFIFCCLTFFANAQAGKISEPGSPSDLPGKVVRAFPNPASTTINFQFSKPNQKDYVLQIFNFVGKKVFESSSLQKTSVPLTEYYRGIYIYQLREKITGRIIESGKFQVVK